MVQDKRLRAFFIVIDAVGHVNSCVGLGQALLRRGHEVIFFVNEIWRNKLDAYGFTLVYFRNSHNTDQQKQEASNDVGKLWGQKFEEIGLIGDRGQDSKVMIKNILKMNKYLFDFEHMVNFETQLAKAIVEYEPDFFLVDHAYVPSHILNSNKPFVIISSIYPTYFGKFENMPPAFSGKISMNNGITLLNKYFLGLPTDGDRAEWAEYESILNETHTDEVVSKVATHFGYPPVLDHYKFPPKAEKFLVFAYPRELWHPNFNPPENWINVESFMREDNETNDFTVPKQLKNMFTRYPGKLIYLSLGSMGSYDVTLMKRLVRILAQTKHRYIVSKGPRHQEYELTENMWGDRYLPQTAVLKVVDLVITHGE